MVRLLVLIYLACGFFSEGQTKAPPTLQFVNLLYRHGARSPVQPLPKHDVPIEKWPQGQYGWLTPNGMRMHYHLGKFIRKRYDGFIDRQFLHTEMKIWSSDVYRTYQSAYCNLHGLYDPPTGGNIWTNRSGESWQPIPVKTMGFKAEDRYIRMSEHCPNSKKLIAENYNKPDAKKVMVDNKALFDYCANSTGLPLNYDNFWRVTDVFDCQEAQGIQLPAWANQSIYDRLKTLENKQFGDLFRGPKLKRLRGGPLLKLMLDDMKTKLDGDFPTGSKLRIYSGHDTTVAALLTAMDLFNDIQPYYASTIFIELHNDTAGNFVKVFYKNDTTDAAMMDFTSKISGCAQRCTYNHFVKEMSDGIPGDWESECGLGVNSGASYNRGTWNVIFVIISILKIFT